MFKAIGSKQVATSRAGKLSYRGTAENFLYAVPVFYFINNLAIAKKYLTCFLSFKVRVVATQPPDCGLLVMTSGGEFYGIIRQILRPSCTPVSVHFIDQVSVSTCRILTVFVCSSLTKIAIVS